MHKDVEKYGYQILWSWGDCVGVCVEFHGLSYDAKSCQDALDGIKGLVSDALDKLEGTGNPAPLPHYEYPIVVSVSDLLDEKEKKECQ